MSKSPNKLHPMPFGKFKGVPLEELLICEEDYTKWLYKQAFMKKFKDLYEILHAHFSTE